MLCNVPLFHVPFFRIRFWYTVPLCIPFSSYQDVTGTTLYDFQLRLVSLTSELFLLLPSSPTKEQEPQYLICCNIFPIVVYIVLILWIKLTYFSSRVNYMVIFLLELKLVSAEHFKVQLLKEKFPSLFEFIVN